MAELTGTNAPGAEPEAVPSQSGNQPQPTQTADGSEQWFVPDKFKTAEDMKTSYNELESKVGEMGDKYGQLESYVGDVNKVLNVIQSDPELQDRIRQGLSGEPAATVAEPPVTPLAPPSDPKIASMEQTMRLNIIENFDKKNGITEAEMADVHKKVGQELASLGHDLRTAPLEVLPSLLDKAYKLTFADRVNDQARQTGSAQTVTNMQGQTPSQGGGSLPNSGEGGAVTFTPDQADWIKKLGYSEDVAQKAMKSDLMRKETN